MGAKERKPSSRGRNSIPGQVEARLERAAEVWRRRCQGATYATIAAELHLPLSTIFKYIEGQRTLLREESTELAERERDQAIALIDRAIEKMVPHIEGEVVIETQKEFVDGQDRFVITVEEWQARMKACQVLVSLLDRKAKLLGMDRTGQDRTTPDGGHPKRRSSGHAPAPPSSSGPASKSTQKTSSPLICHDHFRAAKGSSLL